MDGWRGGVVKYKVNYLTLSRYEEAHRRLNIDALASEGKMKGEALPSLRLFNNEFGPSDSRIFSRSSSPPPLFPLNACSGQEKKGSVELSRSTDVSNISKERYVYIFRRGKNFDKTVRRDARVHEGKEEKR